MKALRKSKFTFAPYVFILPHVLIFIVFFLIPMGYGIYSSFTKWDLFSAPVWIGLKNYHTIFFDVQSTFYHQFWRGLANTLLFVLCTVPLQIVIPLVLAAILVHRPWGFRFFQAVFYMPTLLSITSVTLTWLFIFNRSLGLLNHLFGIDINWYGEQPFAWLTIIITTLWWMIGANLIIYVAAFLSIDASILEAAALDGTNVFTKFFAISLPLIRLPLLFTLVTAVIAQFNIYGQPLMLTGGAPSESTSVLLMYIRGLAFGTGTPIAGIASAMATVLGLIIAVVSLLQLRLLRSES